MRLFVRAIRRTGLVASGIGVGIATASGQVPSSVTTPHHLSPAADSIARYLVFLPSVDTAFLAATRAKRLLVDIGHVDLNVQASGHRFAAYRQAVTTLTPFSRGTLLRIVSVWGTEIAPITGFDVWNGRIVATVHTSRRLDSLVRHGRVPVAAVYRLDSAAVAALALDSARDSLETALHAPLRDSAHDAMHDSTRDSSGAGDRATPDSTRVAQDTCRRDSLPASLVARAVVVRDSIELWLRGHFVPPFPRLVTSLKAASTQVLGCFGEGRRLALAVDLRAGSNEWIRERIVLLDTLGRVTLLHVNDYRFRGHDLIAAFDVDGDGIDALAARGFAPFAGGLAIMKLVPGNHLQRLASGFAWDEE